MIEAQRFSGSLALVALPLILWAHAALFANGGDTVQTRVLENPAGAGSGEASLWVFEDKLYMSWLESAGKHEGKLRFAAWDGKKWSAPNTIYESDRLFINWADFPKLIVTQNLLVAAWLEKNGEGTYAYGVRFARSFDDGRSWSAPEWLHQDRSETEHGFISLAPDPDGGVAAIWLDGRAMAAEKPGAMQLRYRNIQTNALGPETVLDDSTCECCGTDLVATENGLLALYRDKTPEHIRDIYLARFQSGTWAKGAAIHDDGWEIHGCPVNGPAMDIRGSLVAAAWFNGAKDSRVSLKLSRDGGREFGKTQRVAKDALGRVDVQILGPNRLAVLWVERGEETNRVQLARYQTNGPMPIGQPILVDKTPAGRISGFPRMALLGNKLIIAYQSPEEKRIKIKEFFWRD